MRLLINPRRLTPTVGPGEVDEARLQGLMARLSAGGTLAPIAAFEADGLTVIVDGHDRWAAHLMVRPDHEIEVELGEAAHAFAIDWACVRAWEARLGTILYNEAYDLSLTALKPILLSGPSGVGKTRLIAELRREGLDVPRIKTTTTRAPRSHEAPGVDYDFVSPETFRVSVAAGDFCEWQLIHGNYYGCKWVELFERDDKVVRIKDLDPYGALQIKAMFPRFVTTAFVTLTNFDQLRARIAGRGAESPEVAQKRISRARTEHQLRHLFDFVLHNDDVAHANAALQEVISQSKAPSGAPIAFFQDPDCRATYVVLEVRLASGRCLSWRNLSHEIAPMLAAPGALDLGMAFRLLESMVLDQLSGELADQPGLATLLRSLVSQWAQARPGQRVGQGRSGGLTFYVKTVSAPGLEHLLGTSAFFGAAAGLHPEDRQ
jgi:guanylate kinase